MMKIKNIKALGDFNVGRLTKLKGSIEKHILLPDMVRDAYDLIEVVDVGQGILSLGGVRELPIFKKGDKVLVFKEKYDKVKTDTEELIMFRTEDATGIIQ